MLDPFSGVQMIVMRFRLVGRRREQIHPGAWAVSATLHGVWNEEYLEIGLTSV